MYYFLLSALVIFADQATKQWVLNNFTMYEAREIIPGFFNLVYVTNKGAAFSMLADVDSPWRHYFFLAVGLAAVIGMTVAYFIYRKEHSWYLPAFGLVVGGAAGNLIDRLRHGVVVDFLDFHYGGYHWPAFNVADTAICVGAGLFILISVFDLKNKNRG